MLDADVCGFFDALCHEWVVKFIEQRIADRCVVRHAIRCTDDDSVRYGVVANDTGLHSNAWPDWASCGFPHRASFNPIPTSVWAS